MLGLNLCSFTSQIDLSFSFSRELQSHRKLQILKYEVILLLIVYYMKQVPEANWRPSFRLREKRRVVSSYVGVMTRMKQSKGGARRPKAKKKNGSLHHPNSSSSCQKIGYNRIRESIGHYSLCQFDTMVNLRVSDLFNTKLCTVTVHGNNRLFQQWNWISSSPKKVFVVVFFILGYRIHSVAKSSKNI